MSEPYLPGLRMAIVHDWLNQMGGAENVLEEMVTLFPDTDIYTSIYAPERMPAAYQSWPIHTSFMQRLPGVTAHHQKYLPFYPRAFERMDLSDYDVVLSNKSGFCHGVKTHSGARSALHVCYCLTPTRFLWLYDQYQEREQIDGVTNLAIQPLLTYLRRWDWEAAQRVDHFIAISSAVQERINDIYGRKSDIVYPPVDVDYFTPDPSTPVGDYYLIVSRLIPYKRIDLAVDAFRRLPEEKLLIVGDGRDLGALRARAGANVFFMGRQERTRIRELLRGARAFIFPGLEDFGIAPVEAMAAGRPVIAFAGGGALDTVLPGISGERFEEQSADSLAALLANFDPMAYDPQRCRAHAERFSTAAFQRNLVRYLQKSVGVEPAVARHA